MFGFGGLSLNLPGATRCEVCKYGIPERHFTHFGLLICFSTTICCGAGIFLAKYLRSEHCNSCYAEKYTDTASRIRTEQVFIRDWPAAPKPENMWDQNDFSDVQPVGGD
ncbi:hypothetical protein QR680_018552 [Steinernema hermaphroditum]|uniref:LITAF domain-containing protein n=1 Tax=Steinernema hermaphroditum TaxID=289476 RepID=A0AA39LR07_9BILA|nr:hypothetical protein QR680_018552 [Steinernema hermaphroditum]